jgi:hypothetical protein
MEPNPYEAPQWPVEFKASQQAEDDTGSVMFGLFWLLVAGIVAVGVILGSGMPTRLRPP